MDAIRSWRISRVFVATLALTAGAVQAGEADFGAQHGGYAVSSAFSIDADRHAVIFLPDVAAKGDLLRIRPRLNADQYLVLQQCLTADCSRARKVRAWNSGGVMGPLPVTSNKVRVEAGARYLLWMQHVSTKGGSTFPLYEEYSAPFVFQPAGSPAIFVASDLQGARRLGPSKVTRSSENDGVFFAAFEGGAVVKMELLRPQSAH
jgi:hypothetical protein